MAHRTTLLPPPVAASKPVSAPQDPGASVAAGLTQATVSALQAALSDRDWMVEWIIDPAGHASVVVLAMDDDPLMPAFLLHDRNMVPHVATIAHDAWEADQAFASWPEAAAAIVLLARNARPASETGTTQRTCGLQAA